MAVSTDHVLKINEGIIDDRDVDTFLQAYSHHQAADATKPVGF